MAIINMIHTRLEDIKNNNLPEYPEGAYSPLYWNKPNRKTDSMALYLTYEGKCIRHRERNMYDDSDFIMTVWDDGNNAPKDIEYASTRGWSYPCYGSWADATNEVKAKYEAYCKEREEQRKAYVTKKQQEELDKLLDICDITKEQYDKIVDAYGSITGPKLIKSVLSKRVRSDFKKSLAKQIRSWLNGESQYNKPLSPKQLQYVA